MIKCFHFRAFLYSRIFLRFSLKSKITTNQPSGSSLPVQHRPGNLEADEPGLLAPQSQKPPHRPRACHTHQKPALLGHSLHSEVIYEPSKKVMQLLSYWTRQYLPRSAPPFLSTLMLSFQNSDPLPLHEALSQGTCRIQSWGIRGQDQLLLSLTKSLSFLELWSSQEWGYNYLTYLSHTSQIRKIIMYLCLISSQCQSTCSEVGNWWTEDGSSIPAAWPWVPLVTHWDQQNVAELTLGQHRDSPGDQLTCNTLRLHCQVQRQWWRKGGHPDFPAPAQCPAEGSCTGDPTWDGQMPSHWTLPTHKVMKNNKSLVSFF